MVSVKLISVDFIREKYSGIFSFNAAVCFSSVDRDTGRVEFENKDDYENALETLDNSELVNRHKDRSTIRVFPDKGDKHGGEEKRPRSRSRSRSRSKDRKSRSRSRSKDRDDAPREDDRERDRSRSR